MEYVKKNLKQIIALIVLLIVFGIARSFNGTEEFGTEPNETETIEIESGDTELVENENAVDITYSFRNNRLWEEHFEKHGKEFPYDTKEEYLQGANVMLTSPNKLHKFEKEDGDDVYYLESTNEFIIVSKDGYLRTYFKPTRGKAYFDNQ
ncbi:MAG: hypothetical protein Q4D29_00650 [Lachnospiraceae bacterium]|nr:hypothetical protein [Lachnospiraceae bacterium]